MLALATTDGLVVLDAPTLKRPPSSTSQCQTLLDRPTSSTWSTDNTNLFISSVTAIHRYDSSTNSLKCIHSSSISEQISNLVTKDKGTLIFSAGQSVHVFECGSGKVGQTFDTHKSAITSLALSNDGSLLASTSAGAIHVHNLTLGSHSVLRGLPAGISSIKCGAFHAHTRTRLLLGVGKHLLIYDTTRPSSPAKVIPMADGSPGEIVCVACSPFSKTLAVFVTDAGSLSLVDLEKEKSLIRTINVNVPLTSLAFSPEGASVYMGAENGKLIIVDLRALDKPPKIISVSGTGSRVETICMQKKNKGGTESSAKSTPPISNTKSSTHPELVRKATTAATTAKAPGVKPGARPIPKPIGGNSPVPTRARGASVITPPRREKKPSLPSPGPIKTTKRTTPPRVDSSPAATKKSVLSPSRDPLGNVKSGDDDISVCLDVFDAKLRRTSRDGEPAGVPRTRVSASPKLPAVSSTLDIPSIRNRTRSASSASRTTATSSRSPSDKKSAHGKARTVSSATSISSRSGTVPYARPASSISRSGSPIPAERMGSKHGNTMGDGRRTSPAPVADESRTPSPDLPDIEDDTYPIPAISDKVKMSGLSVLGLGTPEVDRWISAGKTDAEDPKSRRREGKGKGRTVAFEETESGDEPVRQAASEEVNGREQMLAVQVSPRRPVTSAAAQWTSSPLRHLAIDPNKPSVSSAQDLLRTIVRDVMCEFRQETRAEMVGLHLDLVRMGRGWRRELRGLMEEYVGDLRDLREENKRLREENERLRSGR